MGSYVPYTDEERQAMLSEIGLSCVDELYSCVPDGVFVKDLKLPNGLSEMEAAEKMTGIACKNTRFSNVFRGAGSYRHYIPSVVKAVTSREEFLTAYTPYQAEISQGILQSIFEYQTQICELTGMDASNASVYDGAVAAAEAVFMCQNRRKNGVIIAGSAPGHVSEVMRTYCESRNVPVKILPVKDYSTDMEDLKEALLDPFACVYVQSPNYYGVIEDMDAVVKISHEAGAAVIMGFNPISLGLLKTPGEYGADIAVAEGQPLGLPMSFGGPYLGIMACRKSMIRRLPGRIVGETVDLRGDRAFVLTLQAREQHIRREKASSNICSNEALCAMTASVYLAAVGASGLCRAAQFCAAHAHYLAERLNEIPGFELKTKKPFFHEFVSNCPASADQFCSALAKKGILAGLPTENGMLWCCTELNNKREIDYLISVIKEVSAQ